MSDKILNMLGLMRRANAIQIGETNTGAAVRGGKAKLLGSASCSLWETISRQSVAHAATTV